VQTKIELPCLAQRGFCPVRSFLPGQHTSLRDTREAQELVDQSAVTAIASLEPFGAQGLDPYATRTRDLLRVMQVPGRPPRPVDFARVGRRMPLLVAESRVPQGVYRPLGASQSRCGRPVALSLRMKDAGQMATLVAPFWP
jgi:hypothetical protein